MRGIRCHSCIYYQKRGRDEEGIICTAEGTPTVKSLSSIKWCTSYQKASVFARIRRRFRR